MCCRRVRRVRVPCSTPVVPLATIVQNTRRQRLHHTIPMLCSSTWYLQRTVSRFLRFPLSVLASPLVVIACTQCVSAVPGFVGAARGYNNKLTRHSSNPTRIEQRTPYFVTVESCSSSDNPIGFDCCTAVHTHTHTSISIAFSWDC